MKPSIQVKRKCPAPLVKLLFGITFCVVLLLCSAEGITAMGITAMGQHPPHSPPLASSSSTVDDSTAIASAADSSAADSSTTQRLWVGGGSGAGTYPEGRAGDLAGNFNIHYRRNEHLVTLRSALNSSVETGGLIDASLLYGRAFGLPPVWVADQPVWHVAAGAGVGIVWSDVTGGSTIGLPVQAQIAVHPLGGIGLVATAFYNVNSLQSFGGVTVGVQIGAMP